MCRRITCENLVENGDNGDDDDEDDGDDDNDVEDEDDVDASSVSLQMRQLKTMFECSDSRCLSMAKGSANGFKQHGWILPR